MGNDNFTAAPSGAFETADGLLNIAANKQEQFVALAKLIGREDLTTDARFAQREARKQHRKALTVEVEAGLASKPAAEWEPLLNAVGVPAGRVLTVPEALDLDQVRERGLVHTFDHVEALGRPIAVCLAGFKMSGKDPAVDRPPPVLGADTDAVLADLGYSATQIAELREGGAL